jgi:archaemetzincin
MSMATQSLSPGLEIRIVSVGEVDRELLEYLTLTVPANFRARCVELPIRINPRDAYNPARRQYHSTRLLARLLEFDDGSGSKILGVTEVDLFIPIFTFVFGEAQVGGCAALISTHRLRQQFYGLPEDRRLLFARAEKESTHELGHAHGLVHCSGYECVMRFSNSVEDVDVRGNEFCRSCEAMLREQSDSALAARYQLLNAGQART